MVVNGALIVIPLMAADVLPTPPGMMDAFVVAPPASPPTSPPPPPQAATPRPIMDVNPSAAPVEAPSEINTERDRYRRRALGDRKG